MATAVSPSSSLPSRATYSCIRCSGRKVKCDRQRPCSSCVKHNVECVFNPSPPSRKRNKHVKQQVLTDRLRHYETLLQEQGIDPSKLPDTPKSEPPQPTRRSSHTAAAVPKDFQLHTPSSIESEPSRSISKAQVVQGQGRSNFIDK
jgi:hypothetical protein